MSNTTSVTSFIFIREQSTVVAILSQQHCCNIYSSKTAWKNYGYIIDLLFLPFLHRCLTFIFPIWENHVENTCITASFH